MSKYNNEIYLTDNASITLRFVGDIASDKTRQFTLVLESRSGSTRTEQFIDLPEGRLVDIQNLIDEGLRNAE